MTPTRTGAELLIGLLKAQGITTLTGIPGGNILPFYDALSRSSLRHVLARSEQGAAFIAQGMARSTGLPAVCLATSGPGATNLLTGIADAWRDSIPIIAITGQVPRAFIGTQAFQEIDIASMAAHCAKGCYRIGSASELQEAVPAAFALALSGRPGPVLLDIPKDVFLEGCEAQGPLPALALAALPSPEPHALQAAAELIAQSARPLLYLGGGMQASGASQALQKLQARAAIPALGTLLSLGAHTSQEELWLGMVGMHGHPAANLALDRCDLLLVAGARFDDRATGALSGFAPHARVIHIDCDSLELNRLRQSHLALHAGLSETLSALAGALPSLRYEPWLEELAFLREEHPLPFQEAHELLHEIADYAGSGCFVATDVGQHQMWTAQAWPLSRPRQWLTSGGLGTMGFGLPAAIGASLAHPQERIVCISGDGSLMMNLQELATLAETGGHVKICVFDNGALGMVRQQQALLLDERYYASTFGCRPDLCAIARGFGIEATDAESDPDWHRLLQSPGPALLRFAISPDETVWPMVPGGRANREMLLPACQPA